MVNITRTFCIIHYICKTFIAKKHSMFDKNCNCFDAIRYILALLITTAHYCVLFGTHLLNKFDVISNRVSIFFIISRFFSFMMYERMPNPKHFAIKRIKRLILPY